MLSSHASSNPVNPVSPVFTVSQHPSTITTYLSIMKLASLQLHFLFPFPPFPESAHYQVISLLSTFQIQLPMVQDPLQPCPSLLLHTHFQPRVPQSSSVILSTALLCAKNHEEDIVENAHSLPLLLEMSCLGGLGWHPGICLFGIQTSNPAGSYAGLRNEKHSFSSMPLISLACTRCQCDVPRVSAQVLYFA